MTQENPIKQAPGCFGAASTYSGDSDVCKACVAFSQCGEASLATLQRIKNKINVTDILATHEKMRLSKLRASVKVMPPAQPAEAPPISQPRAITSEVARKTNVVTVKFDVSEVDREIIISMTNKNAKLTAVNMCIKNSFNRLKFNLPKGINPMQQNEPKFIKLAATMIIEGGFSFTTLRERMVKEFGWSIGTAETHASIASQVFTKFGIAIKEEDGIYVLNPELRSYTVSNQ